MEQGDTSGYPIKKVRGNKKQLLGGGEHRHLHRVDDLNSLVENVSALNKRTEIHETLERKFI